MALTLATQVMVLAAMVCLCQLFSAKQDAQDWELGPLGFTLVFVLMRPVQALLSLGLKRGANTSRGFVWATTVLMVVVYLVSGLIVYAILQRVSPAL